jgi:prepilin-type N-terminal cleavage/methylation domain-containing protein
MLPVVEPNKKTAAFTLIEILMVVVILGILATIGLFTLPTYTAKSRDAVRTKTLSDTLKSLQVNDASDSHTNQKYIYTDEEFKVALKASSLDIATRSVGNICYFIGMAEGASSSAEDNEFAIATWGESTSTFNDSAAGVLAVGTPQAVSNLIRAGGMQEEYFHCDKPGNFDLVQSAFQGDYAP